MPAPAGAAARTVWNVVILVLVGAAIIGGFVLTQVAVEPIRSGSFWLLMLIGGAMIVSAVGWGYTIVDDTYWVVVAGTGFCSTFDVNGPHTIGGRCMFAQRVQPRTIC